MIKINLKLQAGIAVIQNMFEEKLDIGQPIYITKIYDTVKQFGRDSWCFNKVDIT